MMGTAERSSVLRVYFSKVRMPRSQRMTFSLPPAMMYSADMIDVYKRQSPQFAGSCQPTSGCSSEKNWMAAGLAVSSALSRGKYRRSPMRPR